jgi:hypothetical protein
MTLPLNFFSYFSKNVNFPHPQKDFWTNCKLSATALTGIAQGLTKTHQMAIYNMKAGEKNEGRMKKWRKKVTAL